MKRTRALFIASAVVLLATAGCGSDDNDTVASAVSAVTGGPASSPSTDSSTTATDLTNPPGEVDLSSAVQATLDQGSADYTLQAVSALTDLEVAGGGPGTVVDGSAQFDEDTRSVTIGSGADQRQAVVADDSLFVQLDTGSGGSGSWGRVALDDVRDASDEQIPLDLAIALHDPVAVLTAVGDARTGVGNGTVTSSTSTSSSRPDSTMTPTSDSVPTSSSSSSGGSSNGMQQVVTVSLSDIDDPFVAIIADRTGAEDMQVQVWIDDSTGEPTIERIAYDLGSPGSTSSASGASASSTSTSTSTGGGSASSTTTKSGSASTTTTRSGTGGGATGSGPFVVIDLSSLGSAQAVDVPMTSDVQDLQLDQLATLLNIDLGLGATSGSGASGTGGSTTTSTSNASTTSSTGG